MQCGSRKSIPLLIERENADYCLQSGTPIPIGTLCASSLHAEACRAVSVTANLLTDQFDIHRARGCTHSDPYHVPKPKETAR